MRTKLIILSFAFAFLSLALFQPTLAYSPLKQDRVIVKFSGRVDKQAVASKQKARIVSEIPELGVTVLESEDGIGNLISRFLREDIEYIEPDAKAQAFTNDPLYQNQWALPKISWNLLDASSSAYNIASPSAIIAVVDTGVDYTHPDLAGKVDTGNDYDFVSSDNDAIDDNLHGTHVAGIAAASTGNTAGVAGVSINSVNILSVKVLDQNGSGYHSWVASGIIYAADHGAKVINLSLGGNVKSQTLENAVNYAWNKGSVIVAAAGNSNNTSKTYPGAYTNSMAVWASDQNDNKASFSSYGSWVDIGAPGVNILSTVPVALDPDGNGDGYYYANGTSMATPHTAGLAGLLFSQHPSWTNQQVRSKIESSSDPLTSRLYRRGNLGKGRINVYRALTQ